MSELPDSQTDIEGPLQLDRLRLDHCPDCGYSLTGLPEEGLCPECGFAYNPEMIVLYGWAGKVRVNEANQRPGAVRTFMLWLRALLVVGVVWLAFLPSGDPTFVWVPLVVTVIAGRVVYRRHQLLRQAPGPVQFRLFPEGFAQRDGIGPVRLRPWRRGRHLRVKRVFSRTHRIRSYTWYQPAFLGWRHVDFMFKASPRAVERIQERIDRWRAASRMSRQAVDGQ